MESNFTSLEVSKEMKELGFGQETHFYWQWHCVNGKWFLRSNSQVTDSLYPYENFCSAYLFTELLEMIPEDMPLFLLPASIIESLKKGQPTNIVSVQPPSVKILTPDNLAKLIIQLKKENKL